MWSRSNWPRSHWTACYWYGQAQQAPTGEWIGWHFQPPRPQRRRTPIEALWAIL